jgi:hypothetical protein
MTRSASFAASLSSGETDDSLQPRHRLCKKRIDSVGLNAIRPQQRGNHMTTATHALLVGVFDDRLAAEEAVSDLEEAGFTKDDIGFALRGDDVTRGGTVTDSVGAKDDTGAAAGAVTGGVVGGLLGAAAAILIPGVGPVLAAGILASSVGFGAAGVAVGGTLGAMIGAGLTEEEAKYYDKAFKSGSAIVTVHPGERDGEAAAILRRHGGYDMQTSDDRAL